MQIDPAKQQARRTFSNRGTGLSGEPIDPGLTCSPCGFAKDARSRLPNCTLSLVGNSVLLHTKSRPGAVLTDERVNQAVECLLLQRLTNFSKKIAGKPEYNGSIALSSILMLLTESHSNTSLQNNISLQ